MFSGVTTHFKMIGAPDNVTMGMDCKARPDNQ